MKAAERLGLCLLVVGAVGCGAVEIRPDSQLAADGEVHAVHYERNLFAADEARLGGYVVEKLDIDWTRGGATKIGEVSLSGSMKRYRFTVRAPDGKASHAECASTYEATAAAVPILGGTMTRSDGGLDCTFTGEDGGPDGSLVLEGDGDGDQRLTGRLASGGGDLEVVSVSQDAGGHRHADPLGFEIRGEDRASALLQTVGKRRLWVLREMDPGRKLTVMTAGLALTIHDEVMDELAAASNDGT